MAQLSYVIFTTLSWFIMILLVAMMVRAVTGWFVQEPNAFTGFLFVVTEPVIMPMRFLCDRLGWFRGLPFDMPFFITSLLLALLEFILRSAV